MYGDKNNGFGFVEIFSPTCLLRIGLKRALTTGITREKNQRGKAFNGVFLPCLNFLCLFLAWFHDHESVWENLCKRWILIYRHICTLGKSDARCAHLLARKFVLCRDTWQMEKRMDK